MKHDRSALLDEAREDEQPKQPVHLTSAVPKKPSTTLLPCPFCGGKDIKLHREAHEPEGWFTQCQTCIAAAPYFNHETDRLHTTKAQARAAWNRRAVGASSEQAGANEHDFGSRIEHLLALVQRQRELLMQAREELLFASSVGGDYSDLIAAIDALEPVKGEQA
jgi:Lar family restriction alleviation protein